MAKKMPKRPIVAKLHRSMNHTTEVMWIRYYSNATNAIRRGVELAILTGHPGDTLEVSSSHFGYLIATVKLTVGANSLVNLEVKFDVIDQLAIERRLHSKAKL
jgi:hypothetical protein